ncbi:MFS transporter (plasmid) [Nitrobacteraceae bacterium UC4446_H13]
MNFSGVRRVNLGMVAFCAATSIPMSFFYFVLPAVLRQAGHSAEVVGLVALVYLPYALRVLWAPLVDRIAAGKAVRYRGMALAMLIAAILSILGFVAVNPRVDLVATLGIATLVFAFLATGLTALDGYVLVTLGAAGRERITAYQVTGFTLGAIVLGVGSILTDGIEWTTLALLLAVTTAILTVPLLILPKTDPSSQMQSPSNVPHGIWHFVRRPAVRRRIAVSMLAHAGLGLPAGYLPVLQVDAGLTPGQIGMFGAIGSNVSGLIAAVAAGALVARFGGWRALRSVAFLGAAIYGVAALTHEHLNGPIFAVNLALIVMALGYGYIVPYRALVLKICDTEKGATQAALLSCFDVVISLVSASISGLLVASVGLTGLLLLSAMACVAGALIAIRAQSRDDDPVLVNSAQVPA